MNSKSSENSVGKANTSRGESSQRLPSPPTRDHSLCGLCGRVQHGRGQPQLDERAPQHNLVDGMARCQTNDLDGTGLAETVAAGRCLQVVLQGKREWRG
jgi:hypothetical protein